MKAMPAIPSKADTKSRRAKAALANTVPNRAMAARKLPWVRASRVST